MGHKEPLHSLPGLPLGGPVPADHPAGHLADSEPSHVVGFGDLADSPIGWEHAWIDLGGEG